MLLKKKKKKNIFCSLASWQQLKELAGFSLWVHIGPRHNPVFDNVLMSEKFFQMQRRENGRINNL